MVTQSTNPNSVPRLPFSTQFQTCFKFVLWTQQIETIAQNENRVIAGYYAACENFKDNTVDKCPGQKIAEKIAEYFPSAIFIVVSVQKR